MSRTDIAHSDASYPEEFTGSLHALLGVLIDDDGDILQQVLKQSLLKMQAELVYERTLLKGINSLEQVSENKHGKKFDGLTAIQQQSIILSLSKSSDVFMSRFFQTVNQAALQHYYALPGSWKQLGFDGPPQPAGFPDHARSPSRAT